MKKNENHLMITGSNGFIGRNLVKKLSKNFFVHAYVRKKNKIIPQKNILYIEKDLSKIKRISKNIKILIHCASKTPPSYSQKRCYKNNKSVDTNILNIIKKSNVRTFIYLSSISVYGDKDGKVVSENTVTKPNDLYGKSKYETELKINKLSKKLSIKFIILRLCTIIGKNCHSTFLSKVSKDIKNKKTIKVFGVENLFNACMHIDTFCSNILSILKNKKIKNNFNMVILQSHKPVKLNRILQRLKAKLNKSLIINAVKTKDKGFLIKSKNFKKLNLRFKNTLFEINKFSSNLK